MSKKINKVKKIEKLNKFMKTSDRHIYFLAFNSMVMKADYKYLDIVDDVKRLVRYRFEEECEIYYLGSRVMGLADEDESDLDFFIDIGRCSYYKKRDMEEDEHKMKFLLSILEKLPKEWEIKKYNPTVPSLKAIHLQSKIKCDISVTNGLAVHNSELLAHLFELQPEAVAFYHFVKRWLRIFDVKFKGFTMTLLVVFFLQRLNFFPPIRRVQRNVPEKIIDGYAVQFDKTRTCDDYGVEEMTYYRNHLRNFFKFFAHFDYESYVIDCYTGMAINKNDCSYHIDSNHPMTIAAPLLRRSNCSKYLSNLDLANFVTACSFSYHYLDEYKPPKSMSDYEFYYSTHNNSITKYENYSY